MICPKCGYNNLPGVIYCANCRIQMPQEPPQYAPQPQYQQQYPPQQPTYAQQQPYPQPAQYPTQQQYGAYPPQQMMGAPPVPKKSHVGLVIGVIAIVAILIIAVVLVVFVFKGGGGAAATMTNFVNAVNSKSASSIISSTIAKFTAFPASVTAMIQSSLNTLGTYVVSITEQTTWGKAVVDASYGTDVTYWITQMESYLSVDVTDYAIVQFSGTNNDNGFPYTLTDEEAFMVQIQNGWYLAMESSFLTTDIGYDDWLDIWFSW